MDLLCSQIEFLSTDVLKHFTRVELYHLFLQSLMSLFDSSELETNRMDETLSWMSLGRTIIRILLVYAPFRSGFSWHQDNHYCVGDTYTILLR